MIGYVDGYREVAELLSKVIERAHKDAQGELYCVPPAQREKVREEAAEWLSELQSAVGEVYGKGESECLKMSEIM